VLKNDAALQIAANNIKLFILKYTFLSMAGEPCFVFIKMDLKNFLAQKVKQTQWCKRL